MAAACVSEKKRGGDAESSRTRERDQGGKEFRDPPGRAGRLERNRKNGNQGDKTDKGETVGGN